MSGGEGSSFQIGGSIEHRFITTVPVKATEAIAEFPTSGVSVASSPSPRCLDGRGGGYSAGTKTEVAEV